jgi:Rrf2 family protein
MKLTRAANYAVQAVVYLAGVKKDGPTPSHLIARERGISEKFLLKILKPLVSARLLRSVKGPHGGYRLAKAANEISLLEVVEAIEGPIRGQVPGEPPRNAVSRKLEAICRQAAEQQRKHLGGIKVSDLSARD